MNRGISVIMAASFLAVGCNSEPDKSDNLKASEQGSLLKSNKAVSKECARPTLLLEEGRSLPASLESAGSDFKALESVLDRGFKAACEAKIVTSAGLLDKQGKTVSNIFLRNSEGANELFLYSTDDGRVMLEDAFFQNGSDKVNIPDEAAVTEAIFCYTQIISLRPGQEIASRCMPD